MRRVLALVVTVLSAPLLAAQMDGAVEWLPDLVARSAQRPPPRLPLEPDAEVIGPITDPRPIIDGNYPVDRGHKMAGFFENDKPRLPPDYVRHLQEQGLSPEQIRHGANPPRRRPVAAGVQSSRLERAPAPIRLPGGYSLHLVPDDALVAPDSARHQPPQVTASPDLYPAVQEVPTPSVEHLRAAGRSRPAGQRFDTAAAQPRQRLNAAGLAEADGLRRPEWPGLMDSTEVRQQHEQMRQRMDELWRRAGSAPLIAAPRRDGSEVLVEHRQRSSDSPYLRESYKVFRSPGGRRVSYRKHTKYSYSRPRRALDPYEKLMAYWGPYADLVALRRLQKAEVAAGPKPLTR